MYFMNLSMCNNIMQTFLFVCYCKLVCVRRNKHLHYMYNYLPITIVLVKYILNFGSEFIFMQSIP